MNQRESWEKFESQQWENKREGGRRKKEGREEKKEGGCGARVWWKAPSAARCEKSPGSTRKRSRWIATYRLLKLLWIFTGKMYERHKRKYSFCAKGERSGDVVLIKVGKLSAPHNKLWETASAVA